MVSRPRRLLIGFAATPGILSVLGITDQPEWIFPILVVWGGIVYPMITVRRWQLFGAR